MKNKDKLELIYSQGKCLERAKRYDCFHAESLHFAINLAHTYNVFIKSVEKSIGKFGLSLAAFNALMIFIEYPECRMNEVGDMLLVSGANITYLIDTLEKKGLVERSSSLEDRRAKSVRVTEKGKSLADSILPSHHRDLHEITKSLNDAELLALSEGLLKLRQGILSYQEENK